MLLLGAIKVAQAALKVNPQSFERINNLWAASLTALEQSIAKAELEILGKIHLEQPFVELAGTSYKNPFIHFSEALIEKTGANKVAAQAAEIGAQVVKAAAKAKNFTLEKASVCGWNLSETGSMIENRYYTKHALERMAPDTFEVRAILQDRALKQGITPGGSKDMIKKFQDYVNPRGISPSVVEDTIRVGKLIEGIGKYEGTFNYITNEIKVVLNKTGDVITVHKLS